MKLVSILIPVRNAEPYIGDALKSALDQTWPNIEVIVVDDGSDDGSLEIIRSFTDSRIIILEGEGAGAAYARNFAFQHASGDYVQYLDADDLLAPDKIASQMEQLEGKDERCVSSCSWLRFHGHPDNGMLVPEPVWKHYDDPLTWLIGSWEGGGMMMNSAWLIPRQLVSQSGGWRSELSLNDDGEFFCRVLLLATSIVFVPEAIAYYRSGMVGSLSQRLDNRAAESLFQSYGLYEEQILAHEDSDRVRHALMRNYLSFIYQYHPDYPELIEQCRVRISKLGFAQLEPIGGRRARWLTRIMGFDNMLWLRQIFKRVAN